MRAGKRVRLGASAGAAVFPDDGATYEALLADADRRMYRDKAVRGGRLALHAAPGPSSWPSSTPVPAPTPRRPSRADRSSVRATRSRTSCPASATSASTVRHSELPDVP